MPWSHSLALLVPIIVVGLVMVVLAFSYRQAELAYAREGLQVTGRVTERWITSSSDSADQHHIRYEFTTAEGAPQGGSDTISAQSYAGTDVGDAVVVMYLASDPATNRTSGAAPTWALYLLGLAGGLMAIGGSWILIRNSLRLLDLRTGTARPAVVPVRPGVTYVFDRPTVRILVDLLGPPLGAAAFLGGAWAISIADLARADPVTRVAFLLGFGLFGVLLLAGTPAGLRRGLHAAVLEVGPEGVWLPEMGRLRWFEVAEVRIGPVTGFAGDDAEVTYQRLVIVPADPARAEAVRRSPSWSLVRGFYGVAKRLRPRAAVPNLDATAPFGVYDYDLGGSLQTALEVVGLYRTVEGLGSSVTSGLHAPG